MTVAGQCCRERHANERAAFWVAHEQRQAAKQAAKQAARDAKATRMARVAADQAARRQAFVQMQAAERAAQQVLDRQWAALPIRDLHGRGEDILAQGEAMRRAMMAVRSQLHGLEGADIAAAAAAVAQIGQRVTATAPPVTATAPPDGGGLPPGPPGGGEASLPLPTMEPGAPVDPAYTAEAILEPVLAFVENTAPLDDTQEELVASAQVVGAQQRRTPLYIAVAGFLVYLLLKNKGGK